jgi:hypothetical protein
VVLAFGIPRVKRLKLSTLAPLTERVTPTTRLAEPVRITSERTSMLANFATALDVEERRDEHRHTMLVRANIDIPEQLPLNGHAVDLSRGGMGLQVHTNVPIGTEIKVTLPLEVCGERRTLVIMGNVCYCKKQSEQHYRIGLQFVHMDDDTAAFIHALCP